MIVIVLGGRGKEKRDLVNFTLDKVHRDNKITKIVTSAGHGTESFAQNWARNNNVELKVYKSPFEFKIRGRWESEKYARMRNITMVRENNPDLVLVFNGSYVADKMLDVARTNNIPFRHVYPGAPDNPLRTYARVPTEGYNKLCIISDNVTKSDVEEGGPFLGIHYELFENLLLQAELDSSNILITSVFMEPPWNGGTLNNFASSNLSEYRGILSNKTLPPMIWNNGRYHLKVGYEFEISRLKVELLKYKPSVIVTMGQFALWAVTGTSLIGKYHGKQLLNELTGYGYVYPTMNPTHTYFNKNNLPPIVDVLKLAKQKSQVRLPSFIFDKYDAPYERPIL